MPRVDDVVRCCRCSVGYYLATFEAALQHVNDLASQYDDVTQQGGVTDRHASTSVSGS